MIFLFYFIFIFFSSLNDFHMDSVDKKESTNANKSTAEKPNSTLPDSISLLQSSERANAAPVTVSAVTTSAEITPPCAKLKSVPIPQPLILKRRTSKSSIYSTEELSTKLNTPIYADSHFPTSPTNSLPGDYRRSLLADVEYSSSPGSELNEIPHARSPPRYASPPAGSGGKYMVRSKRTSWIDGSSSISHDSTPSTTPTTKPILIPPLASKQEDSSSLKSGSLSKLREDRQHQHIPPRRENSLDSTTVSASSSTTDNSAHSFLLFKQRKQSDDPDMEEFERKRSLIRERKTSISSIITDSSLASEDMYSPLSSPHRYNKSSAGSATGPRSASASPLVTHTLSSSSTPHTPHVSSQKTKRRSSMSMLRNIPSSELADIINGHSPNPILETPPADLINGIQHPLAKVEQQRTDVEAISPEGVPIYQHSLHSLLRKQLSSKRKSLRNKPRLQEADKDVVEMNLDSGLPTEMASQPSYDVPLIEDMKSPLYPAMLLNESQTANTNQVQHSSQSSMDWNPNDYFSTELLRGAPTTSTSEITTNYRPPLLITSSFYGEERGSDEDYAKKLFMSRSAKVKRWCSLKEKSKDVTATTAIQPSQDRRYSTTSLMRLYDGTPKILVTGTDGAEENTEMVNTIPWVDWLEEYKIIKAQEIRRRSSSQSSNSNTSVVNRVLTNWWQNVKTSAEHFSQRKQPQRLQSTKSTPTIKETTIEHKKPITQSKRVGYRFDNPGQTTTIQHSIQSRLSFAKEACDTELRLIIDGLNEYVERGLQYVENMDEVPDEEEHSEEEEVSSALPSVVEMDEEELTNHLPHKRTLSSTSDDEPVVALISEDSYLPTPFILTLQDLISVAQSVMDTSLDEILETEGACANAVSRIQAAGAQWDEHPEWPCREWYVRLLLSIAALNRVVEWWAAEKWFWAPSDNEDDMESIQYSKDDESDMSLDPKQSTNEDVESLQEEAERSQSSTIIVELSLETTLIEYVSPVWLDVIGSNPQSVIGKSVNQLLSDDDGQVFSVATEELLADDSHTVEVRFNIVGHDNTLIEMEGKGMLMYNRVTGEPSHTMWVIKPVMPRRWSILHWQPQDEIEEEKVIKRNRSKSEPVIETPPFLPSVPEINDEEDEGAISCSKLLSLPPVLCHVCEKWVVAAYFEQHSELCVEIHQSEMDINVCNDSLMELKQVINERIEATKQDISDMESGVYHCEVNDDKKDNESDNDSIFGDSLPLEPAADPLELKKIDLEQYKDLIEIIDVALSISMPGSAEDETTLQSPRSKDKMIQILYWRPPTTNDPTVTALIKEVEGLARGKVDAVNRMRDRLEYNNRARTEFQQNTHQEPNWTEFISKNQEEVTQPIVKTEKPKGFLNRLKSWKRRQSNVVSRISQKLKSITPDATPIFEVETIDTPLGSPNLRPKNDKQAMAKSPLSPLHAPIASRPTFPSIKDFDIIKPISKGAFGSVFLAKKRTTGDYYAIKFLKKSDMIAKNQVTNVKAERMILMSQTDSPFVTKLYYTFQSKDYLYLVLEYLNGGDCSALIKVLGSLPEDWARNYLAEVTLGLEYLQSKNIIHRDLKPDNLLIDHNGHLKLTDFGLSRIGFLDRRVRDELTTVSCHEQDQPQSPAPSRSGTPPQSPTIEFPTTPNGAYRHSYFSLLFDQYEPTDDAIANQSMSSETRNNTHHRHLSAAISESFSSSMNKNCKDNSTRHAVGTPDYLAPESILGTGQDSMVDWWALGVICYEFLYGIPPFYADTPDKVFENILSRRIDWHEDEVQISPEARDFMEKLMTLDPEKRLGYNGAKEVKEHPFFKDIHWDTLLTESPSFIPQPADVEDTDYFDARGATMQNAPEEITAQVERAKAIIKEQNPEKIDNDTTNFGTFTYKNLPVLEKANEDMIRKIRHDSISDGLSPNPIHNRSKHLTKNSHLSQDVTPTSSSSSSSTPLTMSPSISCRPFVSKRQAKHSENSSVSSSKDGTPQRSRSLSTPSIDPCKAAAAVAAVGNKARSSEHNKPLACLVVDDNPISCKILETILRTLHCRCVIVRNGAQAIRTAMSDVQYDIIFMDIRMPIIDGETAARMIKSTNNSNRETPIIAVTAYEKTVQLAGAFDDILIKPVTKDLIRQRIQKFCKTMNHETSTSNLS
ncbi:uncharacterized protein BX663DRAFT_462531 [Cokeromyces recurvatus]|uniref:uncharacterized protein n=1 Tax=Cokeromyces recurvatus TaxID=90255 RepID=UPI00221FE80D|nr:uncharacterized protein BX663DRAFT_462531 [Cokeromyces recurvatus]KAI7898111.1 hypothetical protein BX663DRAFT_462531 [Cokeromyces recurvatus]